MWWSVGRWIAAMDAASRLAGAGGHARIDARSVGGQASASGPVSQALDRLARSDGHGHDVRGRLGQRDPQTRREPAAGPDLGAGEVRSFGRFWPASSPNLSRYSRQICSFSLLPGRSRKKIASKRSALVNSGGSFDTSLAEHTK